MNRLLFTFIILSFFVFQNTAGAQGIPVSGGLELSPSIANPEPGQKVNIRLKSYSMDVDSANSTWSINDKVVQKGIGLTSYEIIAPSLGKETKVSVTSTSPNGSVLSKTIYIGSASIDIIIENSGHVPPLFRGKLPVSYQNTVNVIAIPHLADTNGVEYDPKNLIYEWKRNSLAVEDQSGYGKQSFSLKGDIIPRDVGLVVTASTRDGKKSVSGYANISYTSPSLNFYVDDALYGPLYNKIIGDNLFIGDEKEVSVIMEPFGFNKPINGLGNLVLSWMINGYESTSLAENQSITLRAPENTSGNSSIELSVKNKKDILQNANSSFSVKFSSNKQ